MGERKGTCSVCKAPATYYGDVSQYCISDYEKLRTENQRLREALKRLVEDQEDPTRNAVRVAEEALAETEGDSGKETANQVLWDVLKWLDQGSLSEHDPLYKRIKSVLVEEQK